MVSGGEYLEQIFRKLYSILSWYRSPKLFYSNIPNEQARRLNAHSSGREIKILLSKQPDSGGCPYENNFSAWVDQMILLSSPPNAACEAVEKSPCDRSFPNVHTCSEGAGNSEYQPAAHTSLTCNRSMYTDFH